MRDGWSIKDAGEVLGINPKKIPQAIDPAFLKVAKLELADPFRTKLEMVKAMRQAIREATIRWEAEEVERLELKRQPTQPSGGRRPELGICKTTLPKD